MTKSDSDQILWHNRLGHPSIKVLQHMFIDKHFSDVPFPLSISRAQVVFDLIHLDVWGPYKVPTHNGYRFFLTIVDDYSRMCWL